MRFNFTTTLILCGAVALASCTSRVTQNREGDSNNPTVRTGPQTQPPVWPGPNNQVPYYGTLPAAAAATDEESA